MIFLVGASAIYLTALQASINVPRTAFQACLNDAVDKASAQKVDGDGYEAFVRTNCGAQLNRFKTAVIDFDMHNKMSRKEAGSDADSMIADFVSGSVDHYRYVLKSTPISASASAPVKPAATPAPTLASAPATPEKK